MFAKNPRIRVISFILVTVVAGIFGLLWYAFNLVFAPCMLLVEGSSPLWPIPVAAFNATWVLAFWSFLRCVLTDAGSIPDEWRRLCDETEGAEEPSSRGWHPARSSMCARCKERRPERAHHCVVCGRCVLRMDHHCPLVGNCIGFRNHKFYLQMGFYGSVGCAIFVVSALLVFKSGGGIRSMRHTMGMVNFVVFSTAGVMASVQALSLCGLFLTHLVNAAKNLTAIEVHYRGENPYHLGHMKNIEQLLGVCGVSWLLPISPAQPLSDGLSYPTQEPSGWDESDCQMSSEWDEMQPIGRFDIAGVLSGAWNRVYVPGWAGGGFTVRGHTA